MADVPQTVALQVLSQNYRGRLVPQINRKSALMKVLPIIPGFGKNCAWAARSSGQVAENYAQGADASNFGSDAQSEAILQWGHYRANFHITGTAKRAAATSATPDGVQNLVGTNLASANETLVSLVNTALFTGAGTGTTIAGLDVAIGDTTNTYATIDRTTSTFWQPYVVDPGASTALTLGQIRYDLGQIYKQSGEVPDIGVCSVEVFDTIGSLFDSTRRYTADTITTARGVIRLDAGYQALEVNGCMFLRDKDATAGQIYYINSNRIHIEYLPLDPEVLAEVMATMQLAGMTMEANDGYGPVPLGIHCEGLAKNGDSDRFECLTNLQLVVERPNACGVRKNVATVS